MLLRFAGLGVASPLRRVPVRTRATTHTPSNLVLGLLIGSQHCLSFGRLEDISCCATRWDCTVPAVSPQGCPRWRRTRIRTDLSGLGDLPMQHHSMLQTSVSAESCFEACPLLEVEQVSTTNSAPTKPLLVHLHRSMREEP